MTELVAEGLKNREIAEQMGITEHMVKEHIRDLFNGLGFWNRTELALWYVRQTFDKEKESEKVSNNSAAYCGA